MNPSFGHNTVGHEVDAMLNWPATKWPWLRGGYAYLFGGRVFEANPGMAEPDVQFGSLQLALSY
jgi:hypothetical protein